MSAFFRKTGTKVFCSILCILLASIFLLSSAAVVALAYGGCYGASSSVGAFFDNLAEPLLRSDCADVLGNYFDPADPTHPWASYYSGGIYTGEYSNFIYKITDDSTGETVLASFTGTESVRSDSYSSAMSVSFYPDTDGEPEYDLENSFFLFEYNDQLYCYSPEEDAFVPSSFDSDTDSLGEVEVLPASFYFNRFSSSVGNARYSYSPEADRFFRDDTTDAPETSSVAETIDYTITGYLRYGLPYADHYKALYQFCDSLYAYRYPFIAIVCVSGVLALLLLVILCLYVGRSNNADGVVLNPIHRVPGDLLLFAAGLCCCMCVAIPAELCSTRHLGLSLLLIFADIVVFVTALVYVIVSLCARCKAHTVLSCTVIGWVWRHLGRFLRRGCRIAHKALCTLPMIWKVAACYLALCFVEFVGILIFWYGGGGFMLLWFLEKIVLGAAVCYVALAFRRLKSGAESIAAGDYNTRVSNQYLVLDFKDTADTLNHIQDGMNVAVESRMKSERLKTELITNVSHDLKTPLTAIVSYVDLLRKEPVGSEAAGEYLEVLTRQSARMKKLIEDLVEASKASTGNISIQLSALDMGMMLDQSLGEYNERLTAAGLIPVLHLPEEPVMVQADGRLLWRIFDNLLGNCVKYAMPGTRFYATLTADACARVTFRNISRDPLDISAEELMERFVRGDSSRHTEGSGLGLSIAKSLTESMGGTFSLDVDGDLFKATLTFPILPTPTE